MDERLHHILKASFGYDTFRPLQEDIIHAVMQGHDALVLMPTGGGKSLCFQVPAIAMEGTAIVISPLISLMKDQVDALRANGIEAAALNSTQSLAANQETMTKAEEGRLKILYVSPERLMADRERLVRSVHVSLIAVDEAHCISQWGHDFRPEYNQLHDLHEQFPAVPIMALTATADKVTREDILQQLRLRSPQLFISSFDRPNLSLTVLRGYQRKERVREIMRIVDRHAGESGIIYCLSRKATEQMADDLRGHGIHAEAYHAGLSTEARTRIQDDFSCDRTPVICATIAFGMGIDKSNVRFVIHNNMPKSIESYYQEIGRGGRDGLPTETLLFYNLSDVITLRRFAEDSGQREVNLEKLKRMQEYAEAQVCRRRILLNYFGETTGTDCGNCDVCSNPPATFDGTVLVQKALSAIRRTDEQIAFTQTVDILRGASTPLVRQRHYDQLKTFGCGRDVPLADWYDYILQMMQRGYIEIDYREYNHLRITPLGEEVLYGRAKAQLTELNRLVTYFETRKTKTTHKPVLNEEEDAGLFDHLRKLRLAIANEQQVPAFVVFGDKTLHALAAAKPTTVEAFGEVYGVGEHKKETFGPRFVEAIKAYLHQ